MPVHLFTAVNHADNRRLSQPRKSTATCTRGSTIRSRVQATREREGERDSKLSARLRLGRGRRAAPADASELEGGLDHAGRGVAVVGQRARRQRPVVRPDAHRPPQLPPTHPTPVTRPQARLHQSRDRAANAASAGTCLHLSTRGVKVSSM